jgi:hypothetical protein
MYVHCTIFSSQLFHDRVKKCTKTPSRLCKKNIDNQQKLNESSLQKNSNISLIVGQLKKISRIFLGKNYIIFKHDFYLYTYWPFKTLPPIP